MFGGQIKMSVYVHLDVLRYNITSEHCDMYLSQVIQFKYILESRSL